ncbi:MAG: D-alanyl-D-alanine carboxypeptidase/D-alanyl-D-alanine-endopeptidase [Planctomycetota bacterium]
MVRRRPFHPPFALVLGLLLGGLALVAAPAPGVVLAREGPTGLGNAIKARLRKAAVPERGVGIVWAGRGHDSRWLQEDGADRRLIPASAAKIFTAAAILDLLGPGAQVLTTLDARGRIEGGVLQGDLVVHGGGDPSLGDEPFQTSPLEVPDRFAAQVAAKGIRRVTGAVVVDDLLFDDDTRHATWTAEDRQAAYGAGIAALTLRRGCCHVLAKGADRVGAPAQLAASTGWGGAQVDNQVRTSASGRPALGARFDGNRLVLTGEVPRGQSGAVEVPVPEPALLFAHAFAERLRAHGVTVDAAPRRARSAEDAAPGRTVAVHAAPLAPLLEHMLVESDNVYASTLFKLAGAVVTGRGSWASGEVAVARMLERRGVERPDASGAFPTRILDGSGLSPANRTTAQALVDVLLSFDRDLVRGPLLRRALATSAAEGTMRKRLRDGSWAGRVHAKTGTLNDVRVRALAGYVDATDGRDGRVFAILLNGGVATHGVIDDVVRLLAATP